MRALYQLNEEKLEYNLKVLEAKDKENIDLTVSLKKQSQINIQRLRKLQMKYKETDATFR
jgi:dynein regulatory complex protein 1